MATGQPAGARSHPACAQGLTIPMSEITWRATTSGGPGGQHANRTLSRVEVQFDVAASASLGPRQRARLLERYGPVVRAAASESRSQARNRQLALERLADEVGRGAAGRPDPAADEAHQGVTGPAGRREAPALRGKAPSPGTERTTTIGRAPCRAANARRADGSGGAARDAPAPSARLAVEQSIRAGSSSAPVPAGRSGRRSPGRPGWRPRWVGTPTVVRAGKGDPTLRTISPFSARPALMTARAPSAAAGPSISGGLGVGFPAAGAAGRLDQPGPAHPGPAQAQDLGQRQRRDVQVEHGARRCCGQDGNEGDGQVGRRLPRIGRRARAERDGQRADAELRRRQRGPHRPRVQDGAADVDAVIDPREDEVGFRARPRRARRRSPRGRGRRPARRPRPLRRPPRGPGGSRSSCRR